MSEIVEALRDLSSALSTLAELLPGGSDKAYVQRLLESAEAHIDNIRSEHAGAWRP